MLYAILFAMKFIVLEFYLSMLFVTNANLQQYLSSWPQGQSIIPSQIMFGDKHFISPQFNCSLEMLVSFRFWFLFSDIRWTLFSHSLQFVSSVLSWQSMWPSQFQSNGIHLVSSHWNPFVQTSNIQQTNKLTHLQQYSNNKRHVYNKITRLRNYNIVLIADDQ